MGFIISIYYDLRESHIVRDGYDLNVYQQWVVLNPATPMNDNEGTLSSVSVHVWQETVAKIARSWINEAIVV